MGALSVTWEPKYREGVRPAARDGARAVQRRRGAGRGRHRSDRGRDPRSGPGRERRQPRHAGLSGGGATAVPRAGRAADRRRDPDRLRPHRQLVRRRARGPRHPTSSAWRRGWAAGSRWARWRTRRAVREALYQGAHGSTFGGSPLACAAGLAAIEAYRGEALIERSAALGARMLDDLRAALAGVPAVREIRGLGLMLGDRAAHQGRAGAEEPDGRSRRHRLARRPDVLRLLPPLVISEDEIAIGVRAISAALRTPHHQPRAGRVPASWTAQQAVELVRGLVAIPSLSRQEAPPPAGSPSRWRRPATIAPSWTRPATRSANWARPMRQRSIVLLGHIDTVPGNIPVRIAVLTSTPDERPIAASAAAAWMQGSPRHVRRRRGARLGSAWARETGRAPGGGRRGRGRSRHQQGRALHRRALRRRRASRYRPRA